MIRGSVARADRGDPMYQGWINVGWARWSSTGEISGVVFYLPWRAYFFTFDVGDHHRVRRHG